MNTEPVVTAATVSAAIVALLSIFGVVLDLNTVQTILVVAIPLIASVVARAHVTPVAKDDVV